MKIVKVVLFTVVLAVSVASFGQETPKAEIFGGYSPKFQGGMDVANGWDASLTGNLNRWLGVTADFSGYYRSDMGVSQRTHNFLFGPRLTYRKASKITPFAQALFGIARQRVETSSGSITDNGFAMATGGGLDYNLNQHMAVRLVQADYLLTRIGGSQQSTSRLAFGVVLKLGKK